MQKATLWRRLESILISLLVGLTLIAELRAQKTASPPASQSKKESFWDKVLRYAGISHDASNLKAPGDEVVSGQVWVADLGSGAARKVTTRQVTASGGYSSPVFVPGGKEILTLMGTDVVRIELSGGDAVKRYTITDIAKLVGFSADDPDTVLVLEGRSAERPAVGLLSLKSGKVTAMPYNPASSRDLEMVEEMQSWERVYGNKSLYTKRQSKETLYGPVEWTDVFLKSGSDEVLDLSQCDGVNCGQPSLSSDGRYVVFIKSNRD
jgi:hypothetical protein